MVYCDNETIHTNYNDQTFKNNNMIIYKKMFFENSAMCFKISAIIPRVNLYLTILYTHIPRAMTYEKNENPKYVPQIYLNG